MLILKLPLFEIRFRSMRLRLRSAISNESGQMSVFLALVFQVLFVFFAMVINIGLLVHDKINLQNSVDLGTYYAAQKQAEILNEIAHLNYQIRQEYKLLAWRYWVLGTLGRDGQGAAPPPQVSAIGSPRPDFPRIYRPPDGVMREEMPIACLANPHWWEFAMLSPGRVPNENYCWRGYGTGTSSIPIGMAVSTPATVGINAAAAAFARASRSDYTLSCINASPLSWAFVASILSDYKFAVAYRKRAIKRLTQNLVAEVPLDKDGVPIRNGVIATIEKNLTESNRQGFNPDFVQLYNGLSQGECSQGAYPGERTIKEILTAPGLYFALLRGESGRCLFDWRMQMQWQDIIATGGDLPAWDPTGVLRAMVAGEPVPTDDMHSSLGFEKNPWCMAYVGVKAQTSSRKPFAPFGRASTLVARAFAQPFGGRVGPWYAKSWPRGQETSGPVALPSAGPAATVFNGDPSLSDQINLRTDPLTSPRLMPGTGGYMYSALTIPNFSRFPGDQYGMRSERSLASARHYFLSYNRYAPALNSPLEPRPRLIWFMGFTFFQQFGDSLAFDNVAGAAGTVPAAVMRFRQVEKAAIAPNLFDIAYYSIEPNANLTYLQIARNQPDRYNRGAHVAVGDLGHRTGVPDLESVNVESQVEAANGGGTNGPGLDPSLRASLFWFIQRWEHLLTGWAPHRVTNFAFPNERFGICNPGSEAAPSVMIPGKCAGGGRVGYSVRLISRAHLRGVWTLGGSDPNPGPILNPPPDDSVF